MSSLRRKCWTGLAGITLASASAASFALLTPYYATQLGPEGPSSTPPALVQPVSGAVAAFNSSMTVLGRNEFEAGTTGFSYTGGTASVTSGSPTIVDPSMLSDFGLGRYNLTANVGGGHWLEATSDFTYRLSSAVTAFSFFGTDFGDFDGALSIDFLSGSTLVYASGPLSSPGLNVNGNLTFFGLISDVAFDSVVFRITQGVGTTVDTLGFDSFVVGTASPTGGGTVPEPGTLGLVALALVGLGVSANKTRRAPQS